MSEIHEICNDWKSFSIKIVQESDIPRIKTYLTSNFHLDEPVGQKLPQDDEFIEHTNEKMGLLLSKHQGLSLMAVDQKSRDIAGVQLMFIWKKEDAELEKAHLTGRLNSDSETPPAAIFRQRKVMNAMYAPMKKTQLGLFDTYKVEEIGWNFVASTGRSYRGQGLASELSRRMILLLQSTKVKLTFSMFTSPFSRRCATRNGFVEIDRCHWSEALDEDGKAVMPDAHGPEDFVALMILKL
ncbi:uncharacterized protein LOC110842511 [Folsomia candida]|uniref:uncharacterized protein LOC110842511 n=1 Tax=Folsomia candida TaxID=158441 RepID=UPI000B908423|nr:uncharacterized protein LOC110842511 [Folsomia candida]